MDRTATVEEVTARLAELRATQRDAADRVRVAKEIRELEQERLRLTAAVGFAEVEVATGQDLAQTLDAALDQYEAAIVALAAVDRNYEQAWNAAHRAVFKTAGRHAAFAAIGGVHPDAVRGAVVGRMRGLGLEGLLMQARSSGALGDSWRDDITRRLGRPIRAKE